MIDLFPDTNLRPLNIVNETLQGWECTKCVFTNLADLNYGPDPGNSALATVQFLCPNERLELKAYDPSSNALLPATLLPATKGTATDNYWNTFDLTPTGTTDVSKVVLKLAAGDQVPNSPFILGLSANIAVEHLHQPGFTAPLADLLFLIGVRFDGKPLLAPLTKLGTGSGTP